MANLKLPAVHKYRDFLPCSHCNTTVGCATRLVEISLAPHCRIQTHLDKDHFYCSGGWRWGQL